MYHVMRSDVDAIENAEGLKKAEHFVGGVKSPQRPYQQIHHHDDDEKQHLDGVYWAELQFDSHVKDKRRNCFCAWKWSFYALQIC